jgi:hypothetical protein
MAILNFTSFVSKAFRSLSFRFPLLAQQHENISCSSSHFNQLDATALALVSKTFSITLKNPPKPGFSSLGDCRVVSVCINDFGQPLIALQRVFPEDVDYYSFDELQFDAPSNPPSFPPDISYQTIR